MKDSEKKRKIAVGVSYRGNAYKGWQRQPHCSETVQGYLDNAISIIANEPVDSICAGRTDAGVHGTGQVAHFVTEAKRSQHGWKMGINTNLPKDIRVNWVKEVDCSFHARFSAHHRRYHYVIEDNSLGNALFCGLVTPFRYELDEKKMHAGAQHLLGEHDFTSFRASQCQASSACRHIDFITVTRYGHFIVVDIQANAFLYHMVRNIVGALLVIGRGEQSPEWLADILKIKDRCKAPATAKSDGLYLVEVGYNDVFDLPIGGDVLPFICS